MRLKPFALLLAVLSFGFAEDGQSAGSDAPSPPRVSLAVHGEPLETIVTGEGASERTRLAATTLARYLSRITGAEFGASTGDGSRGLAVGLPGDFPKLPFTRRWADPLRPRTGPSVDCSALFRPKRRGVAPAQRGRRLRQGLTAEEECTMAVFDND